MKKNTAPKGIKIKMSREEIAYQIFIAVVVGLLVLCCLIPFLYVVGMSFTSEGEMIQRNFFVIIPQKPILAAYEYLLKNKDFFSGMGITIIRTAMGVCTALILTVPVGYILAIGDLPFKNGIMVFFITTMVLSGGICGLAGAVQCLAIYKRWILGFSPGYGWDGITVATLAGLNPFAVLLTGMFFGMLRSASISMNLTNSVPIDMITVLQGLIVILIATPTLWVTLKNGFLLLRERLHTKRGGQDAKEASQQ